MADTPLLWWLILVTGTSHQGQNFAFAPVPFSSYEDCQIAGSQVKAAMDDSRFVCVQQRASDITEWRSNAQVKTP